MSSDRKTDRPQSRRKPKDRSPLPWFLAFLILIAGILAYFLYFDQERSPAPGIAEQQHLERDAEDPKVSRSSPPRDQPDSSPNSTETSPAADVSSTDQRNSVDSEPLANPDMNTAPLETPDLVEVGSDLTCEPSIRTIKNFYSHLDQQEYLLPYQLDTPSEQYFSALLQKVVDNPPIVTGETDDLFNILQNTAHFFRIVGKKNIFTLKAILDREKDSFENVLAQFYKLTDKSLCLEKGFGLTIPESALYDYAGFFLNTMGGRLYLFRRDSVSRLAVSYYSILIVDKANSSGTNKHGIDIAPAIRSLIDELESSGSRLRLRDDYLDKLYSLEGKYF